MSDVGRLLETPPRLHPPFPSLHYSLSSYANTKQKLWLRIIYIPDHSPTAGQLYTRCDTTLQKQQLHVIGAWPSPLVVALSLFGYESLQHHRSKLKNRGDPNILEHAPTRLVEVAWRLPNTSARTAGRTIITALDAHQAVGLVPPFSPQLQYVQLGSCMRDVRLALARLRQGVARGIIYNSKHFLTSYLPFTKSYINSVCLTY
jgi:hypothetical protein